MKKNLKFNLVEKPLNIHYKKIRYFIIELGSWFILSSLPSLQIVNGYTLTALSASSSQKHNYENRIVFKH